MIYMHQTGEEGVEITDLATIREINQWLNRGECPRCGHRVRHADGGITCPACCHTFVTMPGANDYQEDKVIL